MDLYIMWAERIILNVKTKPLLTMPNPMPLLLMPMFEMPLLSMPAHSMPLNALPMNSLPPLLKSPTLLPPNCMGRQSIPSKIWKKAMRRVTQLLRVNKYQARQHKTYNWSSNMDLHIMWAEGIILNVKTTPQLVMPNPMPLLLMPSLKHHSFNTRNLMLPNALPVNLMLLLSKPRLRCHHIICDNIPILLEGQEI